MPTKFRSGGVQNSWDLYPGPSTAPNKLNDLPLPRDAPAKKLSRSLKHGSSYENHRLGEGNKGYELLKLAGWTDGQGLGAREQGIAEPVGTIHSKGKRGVGHGDVSIIEGKPKRQKQSKSVASSQQQALDEQREAMLEQLREERLREAYFAVRVWGLGHALITYLIVDRRKAEEEDQRVKGIAKHLYNSFRDDYDADVLMRVKEKKAMETSSKNPLFDWSID